MITSNIRKRHLSSIGSPKGDNFMETISPNRLTKIGRALTEVYPAELHGAFLAAEARVMKSKEIALPDGTPIDPVNPSSVASLKSLALKHMESKGQVNTGPKKRDIAASFHAAVVEMLEDVDTSGISEFSGWGFKVEYDGSGLEVVKVEKHRTK